MTTLSDRRFRVKPIVHAGESPPGSCPLRRATNHRLPIKRLPAAFRLIAAIGLLGGVSSASAEDPAALAVEVSPAALSLLPADHPEGKGAIVRLVSLKRAANVSEPTLSTFIVDYEPGGSAVLHRSRRAGYVFVHVLSGSIQAQAWHAVVGFYPAGQTWTQTTLASDITSRNASGTERARALVILVTDISE